jgi:hypothetical protein
MMIWPFGSNTQSFMLRPYGMVSRVLRQQQQQSLLR